MDYGLNGSGDTRPVEAQGQINAKRQEVLVNLFSYALGNILLGSDSESNQPVRAGDKFNSIGINPSTGEVFRYGLPSTDTSYVGGVPPNAAMVTNPGSSVKIGGFNVPVLLLVAVGAFLVVRGA